MISSSQQGSMIEFLYSYINQALLIYRVLYDTPICSIQIVRPYTCTQYNKYSALTICVYRIYHLLFFLHSHTQTLHNKKNKKKKNNTRYN